MLIMKYLSLKISLTALIAFVLMTQVNAQDVPPPPPPPEKPVIKEIPSPPPPPPPPAAPKAADVPHVKEVPPPPPPKPASPDKKLQKELFIVVEEMPRFPGCENMEGSISQKDKCAKEKLMGYILENLNYPTEAKTNRTEGKAVVQFTVTKNGLLENIKVLDDPGNGCGKAAKYVFESMNHMDQKWIPGKQRGKAVDVQLKVPVKFKLPKD